MKQTPRSHPAVPLRPKSPQHPRTQLTHEQKAAGISWKFQNPFIRDEATKLNLLVAYHMQYYSRVQGRRRVAKVKKCPICFILDEKSFFFKIRARKSCGIDPEVFLMLFCENSTPFCAQKLFARPPERRERAKSWFWDQIPYRKLNRKSYRNLAEIWLRRILTYRPPQVPKKKVFSKFLLQPTKLT